MRWVAVGIAYLGLALLVTWPLVLRLDTAVVGFPNVDAIDTLVLRGLVAEALTDPEGLARSVFFPVGLPVLELTPNVADHVVVAVLERFLPFPVADNVFWLALLVLNGLAGHRLGHQLGGSHAAGAVVGVGWAFSDSVLREANLHHAPQVMSFAMPLYVAAWLRLGSPEGRTRDALAAGAWMAVAALCYWYQALFLVAASLVLVPGLKAGRRVALAVLVTLVLTGPAASRTLDRNAAMGTPTQGVTPTSGPRAHVPPDEAIEVDVSSDLFGPLRRFPLDRSNLVPISLLVGAVLAVRRGRFRWLGLSLVGGVMTLGPYLTFADRVVLAGDGLVPLPFKALGELHPVLDRLSWPQRWGVLVPLGLAALASQGPRPAWVAGLVLLETFARSGNAPLQHADLSARQPYAELVVAEGAILALPRVREGARASQPALDARFHGRPVVNGIVLPPGRMQPAAYLAWVTDQPLLVWLDGGLQGEVPTDAGERLRAEGVAAVTLEVGPSIDWTLGDPAVVAEQLSTVLGAPDDRGDYLVWWLAEPTEGLRPVDDPDAWRASERARLEAYEAPALRTGLDPLWPRLGREQVRR